MKSTVQVMLLAVLLAPVVSGCDRNLPVTSPLAVAASATPVSWLSISNDGPEVGSEVLVVGNATQMGNGVAFGSFRARLLFDRSRLEFVSEAPLPGSMRAANPDTGRVTIAGAAVGGFEDGKLFALRFRVLQPRPFESLSMIMDELNSLDYANQLSALKARGAVLLDRKLR